LTAAKKGLSPFGERFATMPTTSSQEIEMNTDQRSSAPVAHQTPAGRLRGLALRMRGPAVAILAVGLLAGCSTASSSKSATLSPTPSGSHQGAAAILDAAEETIYVSGGITLAPDGAGFRVRMPGAWLTQTMVLPGAGTQLSWYVVDQEGRTFGVAELDGFDKTASASDIITIVPQTVTAVTLNGHAGQASTLDLGAGVDRTETFAIGGKTYVIHVYAPAGYDDAGHAQAFFDSFALTV
jgi:hypothetical protein